jgi:hypothetical protein
MAGSKTLKAQIADGKQVWLASIVRHIEIRARDLVAEHLGFVDSFDRLLSNRDVTEAQLSNQTRLVVTKHKFCIVHSRHGCNET